MDSSKEKNQSTMGSASDPLGVKFLDHLILGAPDSEAGRGFVSIAERQM